MQNGAQKYNGGRSSLSGWFSTPQGAYVLDWELAQFDSAVDDVFGFRAVQVGLPEVDFLRQNRIPYRFSLALEPGAALAADPLQLPLASQSVDLVVLPHVLEGHHNPHDVLREAERVLMPEGQVVISGFNTASLWRAAPAVRARAATARPGTRKFIGLLRLRDWLRVLGFELNGGKFGCYAPPFRRRAVARALRLHGEGRRALVADRRRRLRGARGEARARHAPRHARPGARSARGAARSRRSRSARHQQPSP